MQIGISQNTYSQIENGRRQIKEEDIIKLAQILGVTSEILMLQEPLTLRKNNDQNDNADFINAKLSNLINEQKVEIEFLRTQIAKKDEQIGKLLTLIK